MEIRTLFPTRSSLLLGLATFLFFWGIWLSGVSTPFVYDDHWIIVQNPAIRKIFPLHRFFLDPHTSASPTTGMSQTIYRPLATLSFALDLKLWSLRPFFFRLENILGHFLVGLLCAWGLRTWGRLSPEASLFAAAVFWFHPVQVETVQWITQRSNILCLLGVLGSLHFFCKTQPHTFHLLGGFALYGAALLAKEAAAPLPLILFLTDERRTRHKKRYCLLIGLTLLYVLVRTQILGQLGQRAYREENFFSNLLIGGLSWWEYIKLWAFPVSLTISHDQTILSPWESPWPWGGFLSEVGFILGGIWMWRKGNHRATAAMGWMLGGLLPVLGIIPTDTFVAERFLYIPTLGLAWGLGQCYDRTVSSWRSWVALLLILGYGWRTHQRIKDFRSEVALWESAAQTEPSNAYATLCLALAHEQAGHLEQAAQLYPQALLKNPSQDMAFAACNNLASIYIRLRQPHKALIWAEKALKIYPNHPTALYNQSQALIKGLGK
ncbi:MAG: tetratricopeptide repeat protein [Elusimicrobia bacterium]|nr:tetratricopeptide repeat protein [Elusimicrobiota bacterium]